jgi:putative ABC transport system permease protein
MVVVAQSADQVGVVQQEITSLYGINIGIITPRAILQARERFVSGNNSFIQSVAFIALLVGAVGIITTLYTSVNEIVHEIETMKAIAAQKSFILYF